MGCICLHPVKSSLHTYIYIHIDKKALSRLNNRSRGAPNNADAVAPAPCAILCIYCEAGRKALPPISDAEQRPHRTLHCYISAMLLSQHSEAMALKSFRRARRRDAPIITLAHAPIEHKLAPAARLRIYIYSCGGRPRARAREAPPAL